MARQWHQPLFVVPSVYFTSVQKGSGLATGTAEAVWTHVPLHDDWQKPTGIGLFAVCRWGGAYLDMTVWLMYI